MNENYFAETGFQILAQARHKFPLEMSGYKNWRVIMAKNTFNKVHFSSQTVEWPTPQGLFNELNEEFGFTLDPCATHENAKCETYFTKEDNGLKQDWGQENVFMNPPYGREISDWIKKAYQSSRKGATVVCLVPARTDTRWWHDYSMNASEIKFVKGRLKFGNAKNSAPFPSAIVVFRPPIQIAV
jgi:phage N-6-adenine-methyltransferase